MLRRRLTADRFITLAPHQADYYEEQSDGTYALMVFGDDGKPTPIEPLEDAGPLKRALEAETSERNRLRELKRQRREAKAADDPDAALVKVLEKQIADSAARIAAYDAEKKTELDDLHAHYTVQFAERDTKIAESRAEHDGHLLEHTIDKTIHAQRGAVALLAPKLARYVKVIRDENGQNPRVAAFDTDGTIRTNPATGELVTVDQVLAELRAFDPALAVCFESSNGNSAH